MTSLLELIRSGITILQTVIHIDLFWLLLAFIHNHISGRRAPRLKYFASTPLVVGLTTAQPREDENALCEQSSPSFSGMVAAEPLTQQPPYTVTTPHKGF